MKNKKLFFLFFIPLLCIDFLTKYYIHHFIPKMDTSSLIYPYGGIGVFENIAHGIEFSLVHIANKGAAWGIFSAYSEYLLWARIFIILGLIGYLLYKKVDRKMQFAILLVLAGAIGNIIDFFFYGHVIDMIYFNFWGFSYPIFNFADCLITTGIILLFLFSTKRVKAYGKTATK